jgi:hypothetical protein
MKKKKLITQYKRGKSLKDMAKKGFKGYPIATVASYGPDDKVATKVSVGIVHSDNESDPIDMKKWFSDTTDVRRDRQISLEIIEFIKESGAKSVVIADEILGCPHEEGIDYPEGSTCPKCPFWKNRDRFTGEVIQ